MPSRLLYSWNDSIVWVVILSAETMRLFQPMTWKPPTLAHVKFQPGHFGINARYAYTTSGRNVGQTTSLMAGILYQFSIKKTSN
jgi:hypothetical protein